MLVALKTSKDCNNSGDYVQWKDGKIGDIQGIKQNRKERTKTEQCLKQLPNKSVCVQGVFGDMCIHVKDRCGSLAVTNMTHQNGQIQSEQKSELCKEAYM